MFEVLTYFSILSRRQPVQKGYVCSDIENEFIEKLWCSKIVEATAFGMKELRETNDLIDLNLGVST